MHASPSRTTPLKRTAALVLALMVPAGLRAQQPPAPVRVQGTVFDSLSSTPIAHALVQFARENGDPGMASATTSADGTFELMLQPGTWIAGFTHPRLDSLMIELPAWRVSVVPGKRLRVVLSIPSPRTLLKALCGVQQEDSVGVLQGYVLRAPQLGALDSTDVFVQWTELQIADRGLERAMPTLRARVAPDGSYRACGIPANTQAVAWTQRGAASTGLVAAMIPKWGVARQDLRLDPAATREIVVARDSGTVEDSTPLLPGEILRPLPRVGSARLTGVVRDASGQVVENARARIIDRRPVKTNDSGVFVLDSVAYGTQTLEVRALGYAPESRVVNVTADAPPDTIRLMSLKAMLDTIRITTQRVYDADVSGFQQRRLGGTGRYVGREEIERRNPYEFTNLLYGFPGVRVTFTHGRVSLTMRGVQGLCTPAIFLDGYEQLVDDASDLNFLVQPEEIQGVEVYNSAPSAPVQFWGRGGTGCGSIVVWTREVVRTRRLLRTPPP